MAEINPTPGSVPAQPVATAPLRKRFPLVLVLVAIVFLIGIANLSSLLGGKVTIAGPIDVKLLPRPIFKLQRVRLVGTAPGATATRPMPCADKVRCKFGSGGSCGSVTYRMRGRPSTETTP